MVVFVVKRYAVRETEKWRCAVRKTKLGRYAVRKGEGVSPSFLSTIGPRIFAFSTQGLVSDDSKSLLRSIHLCSGQVYTSHHG